MVEIMKVLCIGSSLLEITCSINAPIKENSLMRLTDKTEVGGGHAGNIAYLLGKWGVETYIASMMGADDTANKIKREFEAIGVKTDCIETSFDKPTSQAIVLVNATTKDKTILEISSNAFLKKYAFGMDPDIIVSDGTDYNASVAAFDKYPKVMSVLSVTNPTQESLDLCKYVNHIIFNKLSAEKISGLVIDYSNGNSLVNVYNKLKQRFSKSEIIITLGERGSLYAVNNEVKIMPTMIAEIMDTNGAGDAYVGAYVYGMGRGFGTEKTVAYATIAGSLSTTKMTSRNSLPALNDVSTTYEKKFGTLNVNTNTNNGSNNINNSNSNVPLNNAPANNQNANNQNVVNNNTAPANNNPSPAVNPSANQANQGQVMGNGN